MKPPELTSTLFDLVPCAVVVIDRDYHIVRANAAFQGAYGEWEGRHCYEIFKRRHRPCQRCMASRTFRDGQVHVTEEEGVDKNGRVTYFEVKTAPLRGASGEVTHVLEMSVDITRYRTLDREHRLLFERVPCFVTVLDPDLRIVDANYRHLETFGDSTGRLCHEVFMRSNEPCSSCPVSRTLRDGRVHTEQKHALDKRGVPVHFLVHSAPIEGPSGKIERVIEMATDITEMVEMQQKLVTAEGEAAERRAMEVLSTTAAQLSAGFQHGVSMLHSGLSREQTPLVQQAHGWLAARTDHLRSMHDVMDRCLSGEAFKTRQIPANDLLQSVLQRFSSAPTASAIAVRADVDDDLMLRGVDPMALEEGLVCLVHSFSDMCIPVGRDGGSYHVLIRGRGLPRGGARLEVSLRGAASAEERPDGDAASGYGVSLGLIAVQRTIEAQGGQMSIVSPPGQGISFRIDFT